MLRKNNLSAVCFLWASFISQLSMNVAFAQRNPQNERVLIVGELTGRVDFRDWKIPSRQGSVQVFGAGNGRPFSVLQRSSNEVVLNFSNSVKPKPFNPNTIVFRIYETERALISALILDEIDTATFESETSALEVKKSNTHFTTIPVRPDSNTVKLIFYNHRNSILSLRKVRMALAFAINHGRLIKDLFRERATLARGPFDDSSPLYNPGMETYKYNPKRSVLLLKELGWRDTDGDGILDKAGRPFSLNFYYPKGLRLDETISRRIKIDLLKIGVEVNPKAMSKRKIFDRLSSHEFDAVLMNYTFRDGIQSLEDVFSADGPRNYMGYYSKTFEDRLKFYYETNDPEVKKTLIKSLQKVINQDQPVTFLYFKWLTHHLVNFEKLRNFRDLQGNFRPFEEWIIRDLEN